MWICADCHSEDVYNDAYVSCNDSDNVQIFDATFCGNCESERDIMSKEELLGEALSLKASYLAEVWLKDAGYLKSLGGEKYVQITGDNYGFVLQVFNKQMKGIYRYSNSIFEITLTASGVDYKAQFTTGSWFRIYSNCLSRVDTSELAKEIEENGDECTDV